MAMPLTTTSGVSMFSKALPREKQGAMMGLFTAFGSIGRIAGATRHLIVCNDVFVSFLGKSRILMDVVVLMRSAIHFAPSSSNPMYKATTQLILRHQN